MIDVPTFSPNGLYNFYWCHKNQAFRKPYVRTKLLPNGRWFFKTFFLFTYTYVYSDWASNPNLQNIRPIMIIFN